MAEGTVPRPPRAPRETAAQTCHGVSWDDPYAWLRDPNWREAMRDPSLLDGRIRDYLEAENRYTEAVLAPVAALRRRLFDELRGRIKEDDASVPSPDGPYAYFIRYRTGGQHPLVCRVPRDGGEEEVLLDGDAESRGHDYFELGGWRHSDDHRFLAYAVDTGGAEVYTIHFKDLATGRVFDYALDESNADFEWGADRTLYYTVLDEAHRPSRVLRHRLGDDPAGSAEIYSEPDPGFFVGLDRTESRRFVLIATHDHTTSEVHALAADDPEAAPRLLIPRRRDVEYSVADHGERWWILTNLDADDFRIVTAPLDDPAPERWQEVVPHRPGVLIHDLLLFRQHMARLETEDALPRIVVRALGDGAEHAIAFDEEAYALGMVGGYEFDTKTLRFGYSSLTTPARTFDYDMERRTRTLRKEQEIPSGHDPDAYVARRLFATAPDGERVPISLLHRADTPPDPGTPVLLYGYGAYGISQPASFSSNRFSLVDRGFAYAVAHVRGGMERGYRWYREGRAEHKEHTFSDYIACAEHLIAAGYTAPGRLAAHGGSAGGMLVGVAVNRRPDLFGAAVAEVPFVDVLHTMLDATLPLTPPEWPEWGNPVEDPAVFERIRAYSPYDNVTAQDYPAMLVTAGVSDPRVTYWEPAKWVAKLRATKTDTNPLLLWTHMSAGHAGPGGRFDYLEEVALRYAFLLEEAT